MNDREFISRFSPVRTDAETRERIFVQRQDIAKDIEERVRVSATTPAKHHMLFIGPRGSGKSHLAALMENRLAHLDDLKDRLRIAWLNEDETTTSFVKFLLRILRALRERYPDEFPPPDASILPQLDEAGRATYLGRRLVEQLAGRTLLLIVENLDELFKGLEKPGQMQWRAFYQEHGVTATIATSQQLFDGVARREEPFFGFFQVEFLRPLTLDDATELLGKIAEVHEDGALVNYLRTPSGRDRMQAIHHISGGNHRIYIVLSDFITRESLDELVGPFEKMIDELTPYYQERIRSLSPQHREIVEYLCRARYAVSVKTIADAILATHQTVASALKDLKEKGYVQDRALGREKRYELAEPLMRLCVEVKENRRGPVRLFVDFLRAWYSRDEMRQRLETLPEHLKVERAALQDALQPPDIDPNAPEFTSLDAELMPLKSARQWEEALPLFEELARTRGRADDWGWIGYCLLELKRYKYAILSYNRVLELEPRIAVAWNNKGSALNALSRHGEALECLDRAIGLDPRLAAAWNNKGSALNDLGRFHEALECYDRAIDLDPRYTHAWNNKGNSLNALGRPGEALECLDRAIDLDPRYATAWSNKGLALDDLGRREEALECYGRAIDLDPQHTPAWNNKGVALNDLGQYVEALKSLEHAIGLDPRHANSHYHRVNSIMGLGQWSQAFEQLAKTIRDFPPDGRRKPYSTIVSVQIVLKSTRDPATWAERVERLVAIYSEAGYLAPLGNGLVESLGAIPGERLDATGLAAWREVWRKAGQGREALELPLRLFEVGMRYHETGDRRMLYDLISVERRIVEQALNLDPEPDD